MSRNVIYNLDGVTRYVNDKYVDVIWTDKVCYCKDCKYVSHITILVNPRTTKCEALTVSLLQPFLWIRMIFHPVPRGGRFLNILFLMDAVIPAPAAGLDPSYQSYGRNCH